MEQDIAATGMFCEQRNHISLLEKSTVEALKYF